MLVYAWVYTAQLEQLPQGITGRDFFQYVKPKIYGDDILAAVKDEVMCEFNNVTYQMLCTHLYGIDFTNAQKTSEMQPFLPWNQVSFLKRTFLYREDLGHWTAPLARESIMKAIVYYIPSRNVSKEDQLIDSCVSALRELFFHTKEGDYDNLRIRFAIAIHDAFGHPVNEMLKVFPTFGDIKQQLFPADELESSCGTSDME